MKTIVKLFIAILILINTSCASKEISTVIKTEDGQIEGVVEDSITVFRGIPFAEPPIGDLRWRTPQPVIKWDGILKADKFALACPQMSFPGWPKIHQKIACTLMYGHRQNFLMKNCL